MIARMGGNTDKDQSFSGNLENNVELQRTLFESQFPTVGAGSSVLEIACDLPFPLVSWKSIEGNASF